METSSSARKIRERILLALNNRILQVIQRVDKLDSAIYEDDADRVSNIKHPLSKADSFSLKEYFLKNKAPKKIPANEEDCLIILEELAQGKQVNLPSTTYRNEINTDKNLENLLRPGPKRFNYLTERYRHPLSILLAEENQLCEHLLFQLMVPDRTKLDSGKLATRQKE